MESSPIGAGNQEHLGQSEDRGGREEGVDWRQKGVEVEEERTWLGILGENKGREGNKEEHKKGEKMWRAVTVKEKGVTWKGRESLRKGE